MRHLYIVAALFILAGCEHMEFVAVDYHSGHNYGPYVRPIGHINYTLGYYSGNYYNGWAVYGSYGHRYYYAPQHYSHHRHFTQPVVVVHQHVHTSYCEHNHKPRDNQNHRNNYTQDRNNHTQSYVQPRVRNEPEVRNEPRVRNEPQVRNEPRATPPRRTQPRTAPPRQRENRAVNNPQRVERTVNSTQRENRQDRRKGPKKNRK